MDKIFLTNCDGCTHELIHGVACDWQPENCRYHISDHNNVLISSHKHDAWAANVAEDCEYDAVRSFG